MNPLIKCISQITGGLNTRYSPTNILDDEFTKLRNVISWHKSLFNKPGTQLIGNLTVQLADSTSVTLNSSGSISFFLVSLANNSTNDLQVPSTTTIAPSTLSFSDGTNTWLEPATPNGTLLIGSTVSGSINYGSGEVTLSGGVPNAVLTLSAQLYPGNPVMGFGSLISSEYTSGVTALSQLIFDTQRAYTITSTTNIPTNILSSSVFQDSFLPCFWHGQDYQQFQTASAAQALFVSNQTPCMQVGSIVSASITNANTIIITTTQPLPSVGTKVWINETDQDAVNGGTYDVTANGSGTFTAVSSLVSLTVGSLTTGIFQYLNEAITTTGDGIRYYYLDALNSYGFVNYAPPLNAYVQNSSTPVTYICGCKTLLFFGSRLCLFGVYVATSAQALAGQYTLLPNSLFYSSFIGVDVGSPFYTELNPYGNAGTNKGAFYSFPAGQYGGSLLLPGTTGVSNAIVWKMQYAIISFFGGSTYRLEVSSNPIFPYKIVSLSPQFGCLGYNASAVLSEMALLISKNGIVATDATSADRIDFAVPDIVGSIAIGNNAPNRVITIVDNIMESVYFTFPSEQNSDTNSPFPDTTLFFNYRENTWALLDESFTSYGQILYTANNGHTYGSLTKPWSAYNFPWTPQNKGYISSLYSCGNQQGFVFFRNMVQTGSGNAPALNIVNITLSGSNFQIEAPNHNLSPNLSDQYVFISGCLGTVGTLLNDKNHLVLAIIDENNFTIQTTASTTFTYLGLGQVTYVYNLLIETKAFSFVEKNFQATRLTMMALMIAKSGIGRISILPYANLQTVASNPPPLGTNVPVYNSFNLSLFPDPPIGTNDSEYTQNYLWKKVPVNVLGFSIAIQINKTQEQMLDPTNNNVAIEINAIALKLEPTGNMFAV